MMVSINSIMLLLATELCYATNSEGKHALKWAHLLGLCLPYSILGAACSIAKVLFGCNEGYTLGV